MAFFATLKILHFFLFLVFFSVKLDSVQAVDHTTPSFDPTWDARMKKDYHIFNYLARGIDIITATLEDVNKNESNWKKPVWVMDTSNSNPVPDPFIHGLSYKAPKCMPISVPSDQNRRLATAAIYNTVDDLVPLLYHSVDPRDTGSNFLLRHTIENFENRFKETTLPKELVVNGLATISDSHLIATNAEDFGYFHKDFTASITTLLTIPASKKKFDKYRQFISDYGTHFISKAGFGGIFMLNTKVATNNTAFKSSKYQETLVEDMKKHITYLATKGGPNPTLAQESNDLHYTNVYFGGDENSHTETKFWNNLQANRAISFIQVKPFSTLFADCKKLQITIDATIATADACKRVKNCLEEIEKIHEFKYGLKRYLAAYDVAKQSPFHLTALGYQNVDNARIYITTYLTDVPILDDRWIKYISQIIRWPLEYQIGLRGSLSYNH